MIPFFLIVYSLIKKIESMYLYNTKKQNICSKKNIDKHSFGWYSNFTKKERMFVEGERDYEEKI